MSRFPSVDVRKFQLKHMREKHQEIKRLDSLGFKHKDIAAELGCTPENVCQVTGSEIYRRELDVLRVAKDSIAVDVGQRILEIGVKGLDLLDAVVEGTGEGRNADIGLRVRVAMDALDRKSISAKVKTVQGTMTHTHRVDEDVLERIKKRSALAERQAIADGAVEADFEISMEAGA